MKKLLAILLAATMCVTLLAACGGQTADTTTDGDTTATDTNDTKTDANADMIYAVETGSAGEAAAQEKGWEINSVAAQADAAAEGAAAVSEPLPNPDPYGVGLGGPQMPAAPAATCLLIDRQTGRTFTGTAPSTIVGRERSQCGIVLRDPNVSRRHAELRYDGRDWHIVDLRSTNGTLVNDVDVDECVLRDGDLLTLGLVNLEFRETNR